MKFEYTLPGFEQQSMEIEVRFLLRPRLWINKKRIKSAGRWNEFSLRRDDGLSSMVRIVAQFPDPVPVIEMDDEKYRAIPRLTWYQLVWVLLPLLLGAFELWGLVIGLITAFINFWLIRLQIQRLEKNLMILATNTGAAVIFFVIRFLIISARLNGMF